MKVPAIVGLLIAVTGALAAPGGGGGSYHPAPPPKNKPPPPPPPPAPGPVSQTQNCGNGASAYCCYNEVDNDGLSQLTCKSSTGSCNTIAICCNNNGVREGKSNRRFLGLVFYTLKGTLG